MTWTNPPIVASGDFITAGLWNTYIRGNGLHLRGLVPDAGSSSQILLAASTTTAAWTSTLPDALLASPKVAKAGDTMTGNLTVNGEQLIVARGSAPTQGYVFLGNGGQWIGYNGSVLQFTGNTIGHTGNGLLVPSGAHVGFQSAALIPAGWTRQTACDGRIVMGAGTTGGVTFLESSSTGLSWSHSHGTGWSSHSHGSAALSISGTTSTESNSATVQSGSGASTAASSHTHTSGSMDVGGTTDAAGGGATSSDQWFPPMFALVWAVKS